MKDERFFHFCDIILFLFIISFHSFCFLIRTSELVTRDWLENMFDGKDENSIPAGYLMVNLKTNKNESKNQQT